MCMLRFLSALPTKNCREGKRQTLFCLNQQREAWRLMWEREARKREWGWGESEGGARADWEVW